MLITGTKFVPVFRVIPSVATDIRIEQCQAQDSTSGPNKYKEGDQVWMLPGLTEELVEHDVAEGPEAEKNRPAWPGGR